MNFFSTGRYLETIAKVYYAGRAHAVADVRVGDAFYRLLVVDDDEVVTRCPFLDYLEPLPRGMATTPYREHPFLPRVAHDVVTAGTWNDQQLAQRYQPSPFIEWKGFADWAAFVASAQARSPHPFRTTERKRRKIARDLGEVRIDTHTQDPKVLQQTFTWKSQQYRRTGLWDVFAVGNNRLMFEELLQRELITVAALWGGDRLLATHVGVDWGDRFYYWLPAHDADADAYSPGTLLIEELMADSWARGRTFDFMLGDEPYKWVYATHTRLVGPTGRPPLPTRLWQGVRSAAVGQLKRTPQLYTFAQDLKRRWKELGLP